MLIYLINRTDRTERRSHAIEQLKRQDINVHMYPAKISKNGWSGCRDSHLACIFTGNYEEIPILILEDDVLFIEPLTYMDLALAELPDDWDLLYLGGSPQCPQERYSPHLYKANDVLTTHAIVWNYRERGASDYVLNSSEVMISKWDIYLRDVIQPKFNCFLTKPLIATQAGFKSDTCKHSDSSSIIKSYNLYCR